MQRALLLVTLLAGAYPALAQTFYRCAGSDGSVIYSERPCSSDPGQMEEIDTSWAQRAEADPIPEPQSDATPPGEQGTAPAAPAPEPRPDRTAAIEAAKQACLQRVERSAWTAANIRISEWRLQTVALGQRRQRLGSGPEDAAMAAQLREEIEILEGRIASEEADARSLAATASADCEAG